MRKLILALVLFVFFACSREDYFEMSSAGNILSIQLSSQSGVPQIFEENNFISIKVNEGTDVSKIVLLDLELTAFATSDFVVGDTIDFSDEKVVFSVTSEDGTIVPWIIEVKNPNVVCPENPDGDKPSDSTGTLPPNPEDSTGVEDTTSTTPPNPDDSTNTEDSTVVEPTPVGTQLLNSDFALWYLSEDGYNEIGENATNTIWGTSNPGVKVGGMEANVVQEDINGNLAIKMITRYKKAYDNFLIKKPISAGSAFTGKFNKSEISLSDPEAAIDFGALFTDTPKSFSINYSYVAGAKNIDKNGNTLAYPDSCDIYVLLEHREGDVVSRVATAWFRTTGSNTEMQELKMDLTYGELPEGTAGYMLPKDGEAYSAVGVKPTHIKVVFSSSAYGNIFQGAEGSTLIVDDFKLYY